MQRRTDRLDSLAFGLEELGILPGHLSGCAQIGRKHVTVVAHGLHDATYRKIAVNGPLKLSHVPFDVLGCLQPFAA